MRSTPPPRHLQSSIAWAFLGGIVFGFVLAYGLSSKRILQADQDNRRELASEVADWADITQGCTISLHTALNTTERCLSALGRDSDPLPRMDP